MTDFHVPSWGYWLMGLCFVGFIALVVWYIHQHRGLTRPFFASPYILWLVIFTVIPCLLVGYFSFTDPNGHFTLDNFKNFWDSNYNARKELGDEVLNSYLKSGLTLEDLGLGRNSMNIDTLVFSLWMAFICTAACLLLGYPAAHIMADREFKLGPTLVILFIVPMWMNFLLRTVAMMSLMEDNGLLNTLLELLGFGRQKLLNNPAAVQVGMIYNFLPFMVFPIYNVLNKMDYKLSEAAMDLGCDKWHTFYKVTLPLSVPGVVSGITMVFMPAVTTFYISRLLGGGKVTLFGDLIEAKFLSTSLNEWNVGSALSLLMMLLIILSLGLLRRADPKGEGGGMV